MICLFDLSADFWRNYYATGSGVDAYALTLERVEWFRDQYMRTAICCDAPRCQRYDWYSEYKANRREKPQDAIDSLKAIKQQLETWDTPVILCDGFEADDVIASVVDQAWLDEIRIVGQDKDLYQLLSDAVKMVTKNGEIGPADCEKKFGVKPEQMRDYLALCGDVADNVPGADNVGPGRARDLLQRFGSIKGIMAAFEEELLSVRGVGKTTLASLRAWDPSMAVRLVTLMRDAPVDVQKLWKEVA